MCRQYSWALVIGLIRKPASGLTTYTRSGGYRKRLMRTIQLTEERMIRLIDDKAYQSAVPYYSIPRPGLGQERCLLSPLISAQRRTARSCRSRDESLDATLIVVHETLKLMISQKLLYTRWSLLAGRKPVVILRKAFDLLT
jgi:hypothetical protein